MTNSGDRESSEEDSWSSHLRTSLQQPTQTVHGYYRAIRWTLIMAYFAMAITSLTIFTEDVDICERMAGQRGDCKAVAHFTAMSAILLAGLGVFSALHVRPLYLITSALLLLVLMLFKAQTATFHHDPVRAMFLHSAHVIVLLCSFALFWVTYFGC
ncbi:hypothetical protein TYRP_008347 [Tyrophagus putrescentiae]|nr:hypothetical protein TYRP_008347 [Tyrophagus putrescentiae]